MGKFAQKRKQYFKKTQKIKQAKLAKEIQAEEENSENEAPENMSDLEASGSENEAENPPIKEDADISSDSEEGEEDDEEDGLVEGAADENEDDEEKDIDLLREIENTPSLSKGRWKNRQRVLLISSRGVNTKVRHLIDDLSTLLPHCKKDVKINKQHGYVQLNEIAEYKNCQNIMFFEARKKKDTFLWLSPDTSEGPTIRFLLENINTTSELKFSGNCLARSRPLLSFHADFDDQENENYEAYQLIKNCIIKTFNTPRYHPKSQPFVDHIFNFSILDDKIWFRNYQIDKDSKDPIEIGPRFTLQPACFFAKSFEGEKIWKNETFISPNERRRMARNMKTMTKSNPMERMQGKIAREERLKGLEKYEMDRKNEVFA